MDRRNRRPLVALQTALIILASGLAAQSQGLPAQRPDSERSSEDKPNIENTAFELVPVDVPQPTEKAMRYYQSGMRLWVLTEVWALSCRA